MSILSQTYDQITRVISGHGPVLRRMPRFYSRNLDRHVAFDVYLPPTYYFYPNRRYPLMLINDGQDLPVMHLSKILRELYQNDEIQHVIIVGIYADQNRMREYGTVRQPDYKGRGDRAGQFTAFLMTELFPYLFRRLRLSGRVKETAYAGFSLGGLSALDIAWAHPYIFGMVGVFSGALWWRWAPLEEMDSPDGARIMHDIIEKAPKPNDGQRFWFQTGTLDELQDRNQNGVIDAIDDTLDLISVLKEKGYGDEDIRYLEIEGGQHNPQTWGYAMPDFLKWAYGKDSFSAGSKVVEMAETV